MARRISNRTMSYFTNSYSEKNMMSPFGLGYNKAQVAVFNRSQALRERATTDAQFRRIGRAAANMHQVAGKGLSAG